MGSCFPFRAVLGERRGSWTSTCVDEDVVLE